MAVGKASERLEGADISPFSLRFADAGIEAGFIDHQTSRYLYFIRIWSVCGIAAYIAFGFVEQSLAPAAVAVSFPIRYGLALPLFIGCFCWTFLPKPFQRFSSQLLSMCIAVSNLTIFTVIALAEPARIDIYFLFILLTMLFTHGAIGVRFVHSALVTWSAVLLFSLVTAKYAPDAMTFGEKLMQDIVLFLASAVVVFGNYNYEIQARRDFRHAMHLKEKNLELDRLARAASQASAAKSRFLGMMSHELRTPLNAIIGFAELIIQEAQGRLSPPIYKDYVGDIHGGGLRLLKAVDDILDLARAAEGDMPLQEDQVRLDKLLRRSAERFRERADLAGVKLSHAGDPAVEVLGDERLLSRAIGNLIDNSLKFTPQGGTVLVRGHSRPDGSVAITISDEGPGMTEEDFQAALEPFRQVDDSITRRHEGVGLGIPVALALVELHGGRLRMTSKAGQGATIEIMLPAERVHLEQGVSAA